MSDRALPPEIGSWLRDGDQVIWCGRTRPRILAWPPRSSLSLTVVVGGGALLAFVVGMGARAWFQATGVGYEPAMLLLLGVALYGGSAVLAFAAAACIATPRWYALVRDPSGQLAGYSLREWVAIRFAAPRLESAPDGDHVDWGMVEVEFLADGRREHGPVVWTDARVPPELLAELATQARA